MFILGIVLGFLAAFLQSLCYVISGAYVRRTGRPGWSLASPQQLVMLPFSVAGVVFLHPPIGEMGSSEIKSLLLWTLLCMVTGYLGNIGLFQMQRFVEPSRTAPLQSLKIPFIAIMNFLIFGHSFTLMQIAALIFIVVAARLLTDSSQGKLGVVAWAWLILGVASFALCDITVGRMLAITERYSGSVLKNSIFIFALGTLGTSFVGVLSAVPQMMSRTGMPAPSNWLKYVMPYSLIWMISLVMLFVSFSLVGVLPATMAQSTRALISVFLGWVLARQIGFADIEKKVSKGVFIRRVLAAVLIFSAIQLYCKGVEITKVESADFKVESNNLSNKGENNE